MTMETWNEYRGWAKKARDLQSISRRWNLAALSCVVLTAVFGAAAAYFAPNELAAGSSNSTRGAGTLVSYLSTAAALTAAIGAYLGREMLAVGAEEQWIQARATAEGLKSLCYRFAARAGEFSCGDAPRTLIARREEFDQQARDKMIVPDSDPVQSGADERQPPTEFTAGWYIVNRVDDQIAYYTKRRDECIRSIKSLWRLSFAASILTLTLSSIGISGTATFSPWIGCLTTIAAAAVAYSALGTKKTLVARYSAMASSLSRIKEEQTFWPKSVPELVVRTESLLESEHRAWVDQKLNTLTGPATDPAQNEMSPSAGKT